MYFIVVGIIPGNPTDYDNNNETTDYGNNNDNDTTDYGNTNDSDNNNCASVCGASESLKLRGTFLRKHLATTAQILELGENTMSRLAITILWDMTYRFIKNIIVDLALQ